MPAALYPSLVVDKMGDPEAEALALLRKAAGDLQELDVLGGRIRRTSSRFCLGVEHGVRVAAVCFICDG